MELTRLKIMHLLSFFVMITVITAEAVITFGYGAACHSDLECSTTKALKCIGGVCSCDSETHVYNFNQTYSVLTIQGQAYHRGVVDVPDNVCVGKVGTSCSFKDDLRDPEKRNNLKFCHKEMICFDRKCHCGEQSTTENSTRLCAQGYQSTCSSSRICSDYLRCTGTTPKDLKCQCPHPKYQEFDQMKKRCRGFVGSPCDSKTPFACVDLAVCVQKHGIHQCECESGMAVATQDKRCQVAHGNSCNYDEDNAILCESGLQCKEGKCACENDADVFEADRGGCFTPVGIRCDKHLQCVTNAKCTLADRVKKCMCVEFFVVTRNHTCVHIDSSGEQPESKFRHG